MKLSRLILFTIDSLTLTLAFLGSIAMRQSQLVSSYFGYINYNSGIYVLSFVMGLILLLMTFSAFKLYDIRRIELSARIFIVLKSLLTWTLIITALVYALKFDFSRTVLFLTVILTAVLICIGRFIYFRHRQNKKKDDNLDVHIVGTGSRAKDVAKQISGQLPNLSIIQLDYRGQNTFKYLGSLKGDDIFIADEHLSREQVMKILADKSLEHHCFRVVLDTFKLVTGEVRMNDIDEIPSISANHRPHIVYFIAKRLIDIVVSGIGLIAIIPFWLFIALAIKLDSKGPVLIKQTRIGSDLRPFTLIKFRTMHEDATLYSYSPNDPNDMRITRVGRILRRFSLDELPQLWNIWKGDMSMVGPRPEMEFIVNRYEQWQNVRLKAKPGLTGLWQILGRKDIPLHENLEYDFYYVCNRSTLLDTVILLKTVPAVLFGRGAY